MREIYLDNSATTALSEAAREKMSEAMACYANPSSLHKAGLAARTIVEEARQSLREALGASRMRDAEIVFTASGTEANNLALLGTAYAKARRQANVIVTTDSEHPSVAAPMERLAADGFEIVRIPTRGGVLDSEALAKALAEPSRLFLISLMMVNNETGARYAVAEAFAAAKRLNPAVITHTDAVQGFLTCPFSAATLGADLITVSAHKIHGPKGVGALFVSPALIKAKKLVPIVHGGGQEKGWRSGTENVIGIAGFGGAARDGFAHFAERIEQKRRVCDYAAERLSALPVTLNRPTGESVPHILNLTLPNIKSQTMLNFLSERGIYVSSGSACSSHARQVSGTLLAFGLTAAAADSSLRISFCENNTTAEVDALIEALSAGIEILVRFRA